MLQAAAQLATQEDGTWRAVWFSAYVRIAALDMKNMPKYTALVASQPYPISLAAKENDFREKHKKKSAKYMRWSVSN